MLRLYVVVSFGVSIGQNNWLDDKRLTSAYHHVNQSNWFYGEDLLSVCHQNIQGRWLDNKGLTDAHLQYVIRLASND